MPDEIRLAEMAAREATADDRLDAAWHAEECSDEHMDNCPCIIATGASDRIQYVADAETPELAARIVADHNAIVDLRKRIEQADEEMTGLRNKLDRYVGKEPTLREEMAYLNRCLNAVFEVSRNAEKQALRWENPLPVPGWVSEVRAAAAGQREDQANDFRRRLYLDGTSQAWIETSTGFVTQIEAPLWDGEPIANVRERTGEIHEIGRTW
ncbi:hypothetical protein [Streptomyces erythrochromogenes]|uniref:hypothetical protein n=1 Tax=Streptomyces erythrochromogenes TaxID=285574 RepID=UPI0037D65531